MMETMMWHPDVIRSLSQSAIPASVCDAIADQGKVLAATESMRSLALSALDLELHSIPANSDNCDFFGIAQSVCAQYGSRLGGPHALDHRWWVSHTHMSGYASM
jgi:Zn-dependent oligopeptidase